MAGSEPIVIKEQIVKVYSTSTDEIRYAILQTIIIR